MDRRPGICRGDCPVEVVVKFKGVGADNRGDDGVPRGIVGRIPICGCQPGQTGGMSGGEGSAQVGNNGERSAGGGENIGFQGLPGGGCIAYRDRVIPRTGDFDVGIVEVGLSCCTLIAVRRLGGKIQSPSVREVDGIVLVRRGFFTRIAVVRYNIPIPIISRDDKIFPGNGDGCIV